MSPGCLAGRPVILPRAYIRHNGCSVSPTSISSARGPSYVIVQSQLLLSNTWTRPISIWIKKFPGNALDVELTEPAVCTTSRADGPSVFRGSCLLDVKRHLRLKRLVVHFNGTSRVQWPDGEGNTTADSRFSHAFTHPVKIP